MWPYIVIFSIPVFAVFSPWNLKGNSKIVMWSLFSILLIFFNGLRHEVGGDWIPYLENYTALGKLDFEEALISDNGEIGYNILSYIVAICGGDIYLLNFFCAVFFTLGLSRFCLFFPFPWLALVVAMPYLVFVVSMAYTRQGVAIGIAMWGLVDLLKSNKFKYFLWIIVAVMFHKGALILMPLGLILNRSRKQLIISLLILIASLSLSLYFLYGRLSSALFEYSGRLYDGLPMQSSGAGIRFGLLLVSICLFIKFRKSWQSLYRDANVWMAISLVTFSFAPFLANYSTLVDRISLFFYPIQLAVMARLPILINNKLNRNCFILGVILTYAAVLFVWLFLAVHAAWWLPYQNWFTKDIFIQDNIIRERQ